MMSDIGPAIMEVLRQEFTQEVDFPQICRGVFRLLVAG